MAWVRTILDVYWDLRPCAETQALYKSKGMRATDYWKYELEFLTGSAWTRNQDFCSLPNVEYILKKYKENPIRLDEEDKSRLAIGWYKDLGLHHVVS